MNMKSLQRDRLQRILDACVRVEKSEQGEFSAKWLRASGTRVSGATLRRLCDLWCLAYRANGMDGQGTRWYRVLRKTLPD
jgi:hypothetical protein